ncbi:MAG: DUF1080 domain-containing protein [Verrucomicrobiota bacterium]
MNQWVWLTSAAAGVLVMLGCTGDDEVTEITPVHDPALQVHDDDFIDGDASTTGEPVKVTIDPFEGEDLTDWTMDPALWTAKDGMIVGKTDGEIPHNQFLIWNGGELKDFELTCEMKLVGANNSGIMYRAEVLSDIGPDVMRGYQCDVHTNQPFAAMLYDERDRGIVATRGQKVVMTPDGKKLLLESAEEIPEIDVSEWNTYTVRAEGNVLTHKLNGSAAAEIIDLQIEKADLSGKLGFQVHRGKPMEIYIRNIRIETLPEGKILTEEDVEIPEGAAEVHGPKKKKSG